MKFIPLAEGRFTIDHTKVFVPFDTERESMGQRTKGSLLVEIQPFVVILDDSVVLLDAGLGYADSDGMMQIHKNLAEAGLSQGDIDTVLLTHLHKDHSGGLFLQSPLSESFVPAFPNARYVVQRNEFEEALARGGPSYDANMLETLRDSDRLVLLDGEGWLGASIRYMPSGGHSPHHQVFWIVSRGETLFFGGDEAPQLHQMRFPYVAKYDFDGRKAMEWRREWWQKGREEGWTFLFYHDVNSPAFKEYAKS